MSLDFGGQPADKQAGDKSAGAKDGQVAEDVQCLCGKGGNAQHAQCHQHGQKNRYSFFHENHPFCFDNSNIADWTRVVNRLKEKHSAFFDKKVYCL